MKKGRWYLVFIFEDKLAHKDKRWITRTEYVLLKATNPDSALKESKIRWEQKKGKRFTAQEPHEKGPLDPRLVYAL